MVTRWSFTKVAYLNVKQKVQDAWHKFELNFHCLGVWGLTLLSTDDITEPWYDSA
jgi:hypothetical protein